MPLLAGPVLAALAAIVVGLAWAFASPPVSDADGDYHLVSIYCPPPLESSGCRTTVLDGQPAVYVPEVIAARPCYVGKTAESAACIDRASDTELVPSHRVDTGDYPGPYYRLMHGLVSGSVDGTILRIRAVNVVLTVMLWAGALWLLPPSSRPGAAVALSVGIVPLGLFIVGSVNPSAWAFAGITTCWIALHAQALAAERSHRILAALLAVVGAWLAAVARADTAPFLVIVLAALGLIHLRKRLRWDLMASGAITLAIGAWTFLTSGQSSGIAPTTTSTLPPDVAYGYVLTEVFQVPAGVLGVPPWGALGWMETAMPTGVYVPLLLGAGFLLTVGLGSGGLRKRLALAMVLAALVVLPLYMLLRNLDVAGIQPRYFMHLVPFALFLALWDDAERGPLRLSRVEVVLLAVGATFAQSMALLTVLHRYTAGIWKSFVLGEDLTWWWGFGPQPGAWWIAGTLTFGFLAAGVVRLSWNVVEPRRAMSQRVSRDAGRGPAREE